MARCLRTVSLPADPDPSIHLHESATRRPRWLRFWARRTVVSTPVRRSCLRPAGGSPGSLGTADNRPSLWKLIVPFVPRWPTLTSWPLVVAEGMRAPAWGNRWWWTTKAGAGGLLAHAGTIARSVRPTAIPSAWPRWRTVATANPAIFTRAAKLEGKLAPVVKLVTVALGATWWCTPAWASRTSQGFTAAG